MTETPLDQAHAAMQAAPDDDLARLAFYDRLASAELFLLLETEPEADRITPHLLAVEGAQVALVFDTEERLSEMAGSAPYASMTGRQLAQLLQGQGIGLGLNLGTAPSSFLLDADGVDWFAETLSQTPEHFEAMPEEVFPPSGLPETLLTSLDAKLSSCGGMAKAAYFAVVRYEGGAQSHILAFIDPMPGGEEALATATREALTFSGIEAGILDVIFLAASDPMAAKLSTVALRFDLPQPAAPEPPKAPGSDPESPPRLR